MLLALPGAGPAPETLMGEQLLLHPSRKDLALLGHLLP